MFQPPGYPNSGICLGERAVLQMDPAFAYRGLQMQVSHAQGKMEIIEQRKMDEKNQFLDDSACLSPSAVNETQA